LSSPNKIIEIDAGINEVLRTVEVAIPGGGSWAYNDDTNYYDGTNIWLTTRDNNNADDLEVIALNPDSMRVAGRVKVGSGKHAIFIGKALPDGTLPVGNRDLGTVSLIDTKTIKLLATWDAPLDVDAAGKLLFKKDLPAAETVGGGKVVCDADVFVGKDGIARFYYPTQGSELVIALNASTGEFLKAGKIAAGSKGNMLSVHPSNGTVWAQENQTNSQAVLDPVTLELVARIPTGTVPFVNSFSPDGKLSYINGNDTVVTVADTQSYKVVATVSVGTNATQSAPHPNGKVVFVQASREASVAAIDTSTWQVIKRIPLGTNPNGMFIRTVS
jgi:YVTN family beta-propeller protein